MRPSSPKERREYPDGLLPKFYLVVQPTGAKSFAVRDRLNGKTLKCTLGNYPALDLTAGRDLGRAALRAIAQGRDPRKEKARPAQTDSIEDVTDRFVERHCQRRNRPRTAKETERLLRKHVLPRWQGRGVQAITRQDVLDLLDDVVDGITPKTGNSVFAAVRKLFNWCVERNIIPASPCAGVKRPTTERTRDRVLTDAELKLVWQAAGTIGGPFGRLVQLLALTGARRDEVAQMEWAELDLPNRLWTIRPERVKNGVKHEVALSDQAIAILEAVPRIKGSPYVLTTTGASPSSGYSKGKRHLDALLPKDMPLWRLHDLRRSAASGMARLGISLPVIEKVLNHSSGSFAGIVGVYQRHSFADEKRAALDAWGRFVMNLVNEKESNVVTLRVTGG